MPSMGRGGASRMTDGGRLAEVLDGAVVAFRPRDARGISRVELWGVSGWTVGRCVVACGEGARV